MAQTMESVYIVTGMDAIINPDNIKPGMTSQELQQLETRMIEGGMLNARTPAPQDKFQDELLATAKKYGINFGDQTTQPATSQAVPLATSPSVPTSNYGALPYANEPSTFESTFDDADSGDEEYGESSGGVNDLPANMLSNTQANMLSNTPSASNYSLNTYTQEQQRASRINNIIGNNVEFSLEQERKEDLKMAMLADIDNLTSALENEDVDLSRIPAVDRNSDYNDVAGVLKMLRHKNDHSRYCSFAEEFLLFGALAMEGVFDGKTTYLSRFNPDLTGWHNHLNSKIRRMRTDTSQIVSTIMHDWNISPIMRVALELIPNMVIYSNMRSQQHGQAGLSSDENMQAELANLNSL